ncbi:hypothetical protein EVAR_23586_1 [Eumeta japonica]|uniref:Uncharacterized protein n=1 Tax=Eumeta variegata TaxID=151549 RepID=A0A4C1X1F2_EUMVA|nr:hypothetical protein EVAR_23586_1 [Eumeta japonica]
MHVSYRRVADHRPPEHSQPQRSHQWVYDCLDWNEIGDGGRMGWYTRLRFGTIKNDVPMAFLSHISSEREAILCANSQDRIVKRAVANGGAVVAWLHLPHREILRSELRLLECFATSFVGGGRVRSHCRARPPAPPASRRTSLAEPVAAGKARLSLVTFHTTSFGVGSVRHRVYLFVLPMLKSIDQIGLLVGIDRSLSVRGLPVNALNTRVRNFI